MPQDVELKPCPFCGGNARMHSTEHGYWWYVRCPACNIRAPHSPGRSGAISLWNNRPLEDKLLNACNAGLRGMTDETVWSCDEYGDIIGALQNAIDAVGVVV